MTLISKSLILIKDPELSEDSPQVTLVAKSLCEVSKVEEESTEPSNPPNSNIGRKC